MIKNFSAYKRNGKILTSYSILKQDYRLEKTSHALFPKLVGAPNFFGTGNLYSLGQPTVHGIESSLISFGKSEFVWVNLREEPVIYINGSPFVLRDISGPFTNIRSFRGISSKSIEDFEGRLKMDILEESKSNDGFICIHEETSHEQLIKSFVRVDTIMTTKEVFFLMLSRGYALLYFRIPLPSYGFVSETNYLNEILQVLEQNVDRDPVFLFNSSGGRNRSVFALVFTSLFLMKRNREFPDLTVKKGLPMQGFSENQGEERARKTESSSHCTQKSKGFDEIRDNDITSLEKMLEEIPSLRELLKKWRGPEKELILILGLCLDGKYRVLNNIMGIIDKRSKKYVDCLIDRLSSLDNLRKNILHRCMDSFLSNSQTNEPILALEKYVTLILFAEYSFHSPQPDKIDFISWLGSRAVFSNLFKHLKDKKHSNNIFFPINIITNDPSSKKKIRSAITGRYTVLIKFEGKSNLRFDQKITMALMPVARGDAERVWINLRAEPCLFINGEMFVLRELIDLSRNLTHLTGITSSELESLEIRLKLSVVTELEETGRILTYKHTNEDIEELEIPSKSIDKSGILTTKEYFKELGYSDLEYFRVPITDNVPFSLGTFDQLIDICSGVGSKDIVVQSDCHLRRSPYAAIAIDLILDISDGSKPEHIKFKPIHSVVRILKYGKESFHRVNFLYDKYIGNSINILNFESFRAKDVIVGVKMFYLLICFGSYLRGGRKRTFEDVMKSRAEIMKIYDNISSKAKDEIMLDSVIEIAENHEHIRSRSGKVLGSMTILKNDYFIGSNLFSIEEPVEETKNLRFVFEGDVLFVGLGMPTQVGISNILERIRKIKDVEETNVMWFCLREEPVVYINDTPYVLRYVTKLTENIETQGISYSVVESVESELVQDVLSEAVDKKILLHDDVVFENQVHTVGKFHKVKKVESVRSFFESFHFKYFRIAITDEQAPLPKVFDTFHSIINSDERCNVLFFNCQIGRGRTTTAMIISYLVKNACTFDFTGLEPGASKYKMISKLMQILPNSEKSRILADFAVDKFDHLENLRLAIDRYAVGNYYVVKRGKDFLLRYFYMIVFCEFLIQEKKETFCEFLGRCPEITSLASEINIIGLETIF